MLVYVDVCMGRYMYTWTDGWMDGWIDRGDYVGEGCQHCLSSFDELMAELTQHWE